MLPRSCGSLELYLGGKRLCFLVEGVTKYDRLFAPPTRSRSAAFPTRRWSTHLDGEANTLHPPFIFSSFKKCMKLRLRQPNCINDGGLKDLPSPYQLMEQYPAPAQ
jgi:hypothetical protein